MHKNNFYLSFGVWLVIIAFLGIPSAWRNVLVFLSGIFLILVSLGPTILKKLQTKTKPRTRQNKINSQDNLVKEDDLRFSVAEDNQIKQETEK